MTQKTEKSAEQKAADAAERQAKKDKAAADRKAKSEAKKAEKAAAAKARADKKEADKAAKAKAKADAKAAAKLPSANGVTRPKADTITGKAWTVFDALSAETGKPAVIADALKRASDIADATVRTQYARWRKFHGITGRAEAPTAE